MDAVQSPSLVAHVQVGCAAVVGSGSPRRCAGETLRAMRSKLTGSMVPLSRTFLVMPPSLGSVLWRSPMGSFIARSALPTRSPGFSLWSTAAPALAKPLPSITLAPLAAAGEPSSESPQVCVPTVNAPVLPVSPAHQLLQVRMGDRPLFQVLNSARIKRFIYQIRQAVQEPDFDAEQIQPSQVNGMPAVKVGDRALLALTPDIVQNWTCNAEQLSLHWINRLRLAFGKVPLDLVSAQESLYNLREGGRRLQLQASWYGPYFHGRQTATGEIFDQNHFTAAHPSLPFDTYLKVTNQRNGKSVIVRVNDRGPYVGNRNLDLSWESARAIGSESDGVVPLAAVVMEPDFILERTGLAIARSLP
jgi:Lytic transglycolase